MIVPNRGMTCRSTGARVRSGGSPPLVTIFDDLLSNVTLTTKTASASTEEACGMGTYFEGTNVIVYIRGTDDDDGEWWKKPAEKWSPSHHGVLVNAHYDSLVLPFGLPIP